MKFIKRISRRAITWLEQYFLGPNAEEKIIIKKDMLYFGEDGQQLGLQWLASMDYTTTLLVFAPDAKDKVFFVRPRGQGLLLVPQILEDVVPMLRQLTEMIYSPLLVVMYNVGQIPSRTDRQRIITGASNERVFARECFRLKRVLISNRWQIMVIDHEEILGKKNSALLRRLFPEHNITKK